MVVHMSPIFVSKMRPLFVGISQTLQNMLHEVVEKQTVFVPGCSAAPTCGLSGDVP